MYINYFENSNGILQQWLKMSFGLFSE